MGQERQFSGGVDSRRLARLSCILVLTRRSGAGFLGRGASMNRFILSEDPHLAAIEHCDKHVVKMILEEAQMLSTAHRLLDGSPVNSVSDSGRKVTRYRLSDNREEVLYQATHANHPCAVWARESSENYLWAKTLFESLVLEYTYRYGKDHKTAMLREKLASLPHNIATGSRTSFPLAMPEDCKQIDAVSSYREYYRKYKSDFACWTKRTAPIWFIGYRAVEAAK